jgi:hypothetical protein
MEPWMTMHAHKGGVEGLEADSGRGFESIWARSGSAVKQEVGFGFASATI